MYNTHNKYHLKSRVHRLFMILSAVLYLSSCGDSPHDQQRSEEFEQEDSQEIADLILERSRDTFRLEAQQWKLPSGDTLFLDPVDSVQIQGFGLKQAFLDSITAGYSNWYHKALALETYALGVHADEVKRDSAGIHVVVEGGSWLYLKPATEDDEMGLSFENYFDSSRFYSIRVQLSEGNYYQLVRFDDGAQFKIEGRPFFNDRGTHFLATGLDLDAHYSFNGFALYSYINWDLVQLIQVSPENWGIEWVEWENDRSAWIKYRTNIANSEPHFARLHW